MKGNSNPYHFLQFWLALPHYVAHNLLPAIYSLPCFPQPVGAWLTGTGVLRPEVAPPTRLCVYCQMHAGCAAPSNSPLQLQCQFQSNTYQRIALAPNTLDIRCAIHLVQVLGSSDHALPLCISPPNLTQLIYTFRILTNYQSDYRYGRTTLLRQNY